MNRVRSWLDVIAIGICGLVTISLVIALFGFLAKFFVYGFVMGGLFFVAFAAIVFWAFSRTGELLIKNKKLVDK